MQGLGLVFFVLLAITLLLTYLSIRRAWVAPGVTAGVSVVVSIVLMVLTAFAQGNSPVQAIVVGIVVGGLFSAVTLGIAWYFQNQEVQKRPADYDEYPYEADGE
jgi:ABC-type Fe3+-siderophore transport system permease subunit